jgi:hypothetical protein
MVQRWIIPLIVASASFVAALAFSPSVRSPSSRRLTTRLSLSIDPNDAVHAHAHVEALLSTLYAEVLKPAHEHSQPLFGAVDPFLSAGKSIMPSKTAFVDAGLADSVKTVPVKLSDKVVESLSKTPNKFIIDPNSVISFDKTLPGFKPSGHFLPQHSESFPQETKQSLILEMGSIAKMMRVINVLPMAAFLYTCAEFFLVKPGYDAYKEELDEDRAAANVEFIALTGIRLAIMSAIGVLALTFFGK